MKKKEKIDKTKYFQAFYSGYIPLEPSMEVLKKFEWSPEEKDTIDVLNIKQYPKDLHISGRKKWKRKYVEPELRKKRGVIKKWSFGASKRCLFYLRNTAHLMPVIIHLTYPNKFPMDGELVKKHLHKFLCFLHYHGYQYLWVLEFQKRHAPHFHILVDKSIPYQDVANSWYRIVDSGDPKHLEAGTRVEAVKKKDSMAHYMTSYLKKNDQKVVPNEYQKVGRFWGHSKDLLPCENIKIFGSKGYVNGVKRDFRIISKFDKAQKRQWEKKALESGNKRKKFKKYKREKIGDEKIIPAYSLRVTNIDKIRAELLKRGMDYLPDFLLSIALPPAPTATTIVAPWSGGSVEEIPETSRLSLPESDVDMLKRLGLY